jgi:hypothetical protein
MHERGQNGRASQAAPKGNIQLRVADFFKPSNQTASQKAAEEQQAGGSKAQGT